jgi:pilus assembly protein FimV
MCCLPTIRPRQRHPYAPVKSWLCRKLWSAPVRRCSHRRQQPPLRPTTETQPKSVVRLPKSVPAQSSVVAEVDAGAPKAEGESARRALRPESVVRRKVTAPAGRARLKLEPLDLLVERDPTLRPSSELLTPVAENAQARAQAQALWRAINARPEEVLRDQQKLPIAGR